MLVTNRPYMYIYKDSVSEELFVIPSSAESNISITIPQTKICLLHMSYTTTKEPGGRERKKERKTERTKKKGRRRI